MKNYINSLILKYLGKIQYIVTCVNVSGSVEKIYFNRMKDVDDCVNSINEEYYWNVQKIEKIRKYSFKYDKEIIHTPLHFCLDGVTEIHKCDDYKYSYLLKDKSLINIMRKRNKK